MSYDVHAAATAAVASAATAFLLTYFLTSPLIRYLTARGMMVKDYNKPGEVRVARPGGLSIVAGLVAAEVVLYIFTMSTDVLAILLCTVIGFLVGYIDDRKIMPGYFKPLALLGAALPIVLLGAYDFHLDFPLFGAVRIPLLYIALTFFAIPIIGNTVNSIDVLNGVVSGFLAIASVPLIVTLFLQGKTEIAIAAIPLLLSALAFYRYHRHPSRIFPGDSGTLAWGAMYGAIAIVGGVEIVATIALLPAVMNSFLFLVGVRRITEHREVKANPTALMDDYRLAASKQKDAPVTLLYLLLLHGPMHEKEIARSIFKLTAFSAGMAILTALMITMMVG